MSVPLKPLRAAFVVIATLGALALSTGAHADWPDRPIKVVVPFGPGGANDLMGRVAAEGIAKRLGHSVIVENRPGAGAMIGSDYVAKAKPDGYTFLVSGNGVITNSLVRSKMPYADSDLVPVGLIAVAPSVIIVHPSVPARNMKEFVAYAKSKGAEGINFATAGTASTPHFVAEMLKEATGANFNIIPYKSGQDGVNAVLGNSVTGTSEASIVVLPQIRGGKVVAIANTYSRRMTAAPDLATAAEQGFPQINIGHWAGLMAPRGTPQDILEKMNAELQAALKTKETMDRLVPSGIEPAGGSIAEFTKFMDSERARLGAIARRSGMKED